MTENVLQKAVAWYVDFFSNLWHNSVSHLFSSLSDFSWLQQCSGYTLHIANFTEGELHFFPLGHDEKKTFDLFMKLYKNSAFWLYICSSSCNNNFTEVILLF